MSGAGQFTRKPIYDLIDPRQLALLKAKAPTLKDHELAAALELAAAYGLDPWANEIWFAKGKGDNARVLIMVGRDGLRKIAQRNGIEVDGDVVREKDIFAITRGADRTRQVTHTYEGSHDARGPIVGAWAECWDRETGRSLGYFYAPLSEYRPASPDPRSPWANQESAMMLAAAERQAIRQATPLGGLVVEGETDRNLEAEDGQQQQLPAPEPAAQTAMADQEQASRIVDLVDALGEQGIDPNGALVAHGVTDTAALPASVGRLPAGAAAELEEVLGTMLPEAQEATA
jgi:hypothetical protein